MINDSRFCHETMIIGFYTKTVRNQSIQTVGFWGIFACFVEVLWIFLYFFVKIEKIEERTKVNFMFLQVWNSANELKIEETISNTHVLTSYM